MTAATDTTQAHTRQGPLRNLRVLDIATIIAGPLAGSLLADFGADVLKVELPERGDAIRALPPHKDGVALWSKVVNRGKRGVTLDLRTDDGAALFKKMIAERDVLIENFRPGTLERWGLAPDVLWKINPKLTILRVSAFGRAGPYAEKPGFARVADAMSGFLNLCGPADGAPVHPGYPVADSVTGLFGAFGLLAALMELRENPDAPGQVVSVSLFESMFRMLDFLAVEYDQLGKVRGRYGNRNPYAAPGNVFRSKDGKWITLAASAQSIFERLCHAMARPELIDDVRFTDNVQRLAHTDELDAIVAQWFAERDADDACRHMESFDVSAVRVRSIDELFEEEQVLANDMLVSVDDPELGALRMQGVTPGMSRTPGAVHKTGPALGEANDDVYADLGLSTEQIAALKARGVI
ncbi:CoA transferase [Thalassospiraceae bacterium LMO-JJ14]|nr:CoA transferase [Thalassospiraceae bacterium LMO-JJ14]